MGDQPAPGSRQPPEEPVSGAELRPDAFLEALAHELRNPLAPIRNSLEVLRQLHPANGAAADAHAIIDRQLSHLVRVVDDLLDASKIAQGTIEVRRERCSLAEIVRHTVDEYGPLFHDRGIAVTVSVPPDDLIVDADPARLAQVVANLLHNASKFTPKGGWVTVRLMRMEGSREAVVEIADTGIGMEPDLIERLFTPFRYEPRANGGHAGLGLGLAVVRGLVELHGGRWPRAWRPLRRHVASGCAARHHSRAASGRTGRRLAARPRRRRQRRCRGKPADGARDARPHRADGLRRPRCDGRGGTPPS
jgi:signal transduction histidine kinase